jgi:hypothetical protein
MQTLQPKKAYGVNGILNGIIKYTDHRFQLAILKLFNIILSSGIFPNIWNQGLITPIHKSGDEFDPNNYQGICINSNLEKFSALSLTADSYISSPKTMFRAKVKLSFYQMTVRQTTYSPCKP